jgi:membrane-associated phospholipid phosphatase
MVFIQPSTLLDDKLFQWIASQVTDERTVIMRGITFLGNYQFLIPANFILIGTLLYLKKKNSAWRVAVIALTSLTLKLLLKDVFHRDRPDNPMILGITNFSFPSGHAFMSVAFYGVLIWLAERNMTNKTWRTITAILLSLLILLIGFSRIYLRVHYTTDVIAGFCMGTCWVSFCLWFTQRINKWRAGSKNIPDQVDTVDAGA